MCFKQRCKPVLFVIFRCALAIPRKVQREDLERFREGLQLLTLWCPDPGAHLLRPLGAVAPADAS